MTTPMLSTSAILAGGGRTDAVLCFQPFLNAAKDLFPSPNSGSFYIVSYLEHDGERFTVLFHLMLFSRSGIPFAQLAISVFDERSYYLSDEMNYDWLSDVTVSPSGLDIRTPEGHLSGTIAKLNLEGSIRKGSQQFEMKLEMEPRGPILPNLLTGVIPFCDGIDYEYALPRMETSGTITLCGKQCCVTGWSWLDREWGTLGPSKWTWMNIQLEGLHGAQISLWDEQVDQSNPASYVSAAGNARRFATILEPSGKLVATPVLITERGDWASPHTGKTYPTEWRVEIRGIADLHVQSMRADQEIESKIGIHRVEAKARVRGTYYGNQVEGVTMVEMFDLGPLF